MAHLYGDYDDKVEHYFSGSRKEMLAFIPSRVRRLLEIGCGNAAFAADLKASRDIEIIAIEPYGAAASIAVTRVDRLIEKSVEAGIEDLIGERFDCIVANDVLEHLTEPWLILSQLRSLLNIGGVVVVSLPNVRFLPVFKNYILEAQWRYEKDGVMDRTHLRFFTRSSIEEMFESAGFRIERICGINEIVFPWKFGLLNFLCGHKFEDVRFRQFAVVASIQDF